MDKYKAIGILIIIAVLSFFLLLKYTSWSAVLAQLQPLTGTPLMISLLKKAEQNIVPMRNPYANDKRVLRLQKKKPPLETEARLRWQLRLGQELLRAGDTATAISQYLNVVEAYLAQNKVKNKAEFQAKVADLLALAYLRLGEQQNCITNHNASSCLLPIGKNGIHKHNLGSRTAIQRYLEMLEKKPDDLTLRWLLNIVFMTLGEYPDQVPHKWLIPPAAFESDYAIERFIDVAPHLGVDVLGHAGGSIVEDFNGDGYLDIMASSMDLRDQIRIFYNNGDGSFTDQTEASGLLNISGGLNIIQADYDNNGCPDVFVLRGAWLKGQGQHPNSLLHNHCNGIFSDVTKQAGLLSKFPTQTATWGDFDNDGWLDLFIGNEAGKKLPFASELYHNNGDGTFTNVAQDTGLDVTAFVKGAVWGDYDNDNRLDLYVSIWKGPNRLFKNKGPDTSGRWTFVDVAKAAGVTKPIDSFPTWFWDYNNDGWLDIFVGGYNSAMLSKATQWVAADYLDLLLEQEAQESFPRLYQNNQDGTFSDVTINANLDKVLYPMGANFGDIDNDGYLDFYLGTGMPNYRAIMPNRMFRNANSEYFQDVTTSGGFGHLQKGHGISFADFDHDGDQDIYAVMGGAYKGDIFLNTLFKNPGNSNHWITLELKGVESNRSAIGARITISVDTAIGIRKIYATVNSGGSFGANPLRQEIGLGKARAIRSIEVTWPTTGRVQLFKDINMDQFISITEDSSEPVVLDFRSFQLTKESQ